MFVDINRGGERIRVNLDVVFHRMPCDILSLDAQDIMGTHIMNIEGHLIKKRVKDGVELAEEVPTLPNLSFAKTTTIKIT